MWQVYLVSLVGVALELNHIVETNLIGVSYHCKSWSCYFYFNCSLEQLYISKKTECFSYDGGYGACVSRQFKQVLTWTTNKQFWDINNSYNVM